MNILRAGFRRGVPVIRDVNFSLSKGELLLITGPSGSGKTTLILTITGVLNNLLNGSVEGDVSLAGVNTLTPEGFLEVPKLVGVVLQDPEKQLAMPTPADEVAFTLENLGFKVDSELIINSLRHVGLEVKAYSPTEYLSGGEKKRLCIIASIIHKPKLVIFDEPTANLDPWGISDILKYINRLRTEGITIIVIEHKARYFLGLADKILVMKDGKQLYYLDRDCLSGNYNYIINMVGGLGIDISKPSLTKKLSINSSRVEVLRAEDLWFKYPSSNDYVLKGVSISLREGDVGIIVGRNGCGKSTLLKVLSGLYKAERGYIKVIPRNSIKRYGVRDVFYVPQEPDYIFIYDKVLKELSLLGSSELTTITNEVPWIKEVLNESPYKLSHGQRRWLSYLIARAYNPKVLMFDEPTAGLDLNLLKQYVSWVRNAVSEGRSVLIASHDVRLLGEVATKTYIMSGGKLVEVSVEEAVKYLEGPIEVL